jgi:exodeoxyribonuclease VII large subunit
MTQALSSSGRSTLTVSALVARLGQILDDQLGVVWVRGEVGGLTVARSGHAYFALKDTQSQIRCVAFQSTASRLRFKLAEGTEILIRGRPGVYAARGELQVIVEYAEPVGTGALQAEFERLKRKLHAEGLFDTARKRPLPYLPSCVAVVTSPTGAAIRDVLTVLRRRNPSLLVRVVSAPVQGPSAGVELARALELADRHARADLILLTRGGGSAEDLACFNDETLARAIFACGTPVVSAVGHEIDFTIADFVADHRAPTPSAAAEMVTPVRSELLLEIAALRGRLDHAAASFARRRHQVLDSLSARLQSRSPARRISDGLLRLDDLDERLDRAVRVHLQTQRLRVQTLSRALARPGARPHLDRAQAALEAARRGLTHAAERRLQALRHTLDQAASSLHALSPLAVLERGFAIARKDGAVQTNAALLRPGDRLEVQLARGSFTAAVQQVQP